MINVATIAATLIPFGELKLDALGAAVVPAPVVVTTGVSVDDISGSVVAGGSVVVSSSLKFGFFWVEIISSFEHFGLILKW